MKNLLHVGVYGVIRRDNHILVVDKTRGPYKNAIDLPGGKPLHGEQIEKTLQRELAEETGIAIKKWALLANFSTALKYITDQNEECSFFHIGLIYEILEADYSQFDNKIVFEDTSGARWVNQSRAKKMDCSPFLQRVIYEDY